MAQQAYDRNAAFDITEDTAVRELPQQERSPLRRVKIEKAYKASLSTKLVCVLSVLMAAFIVYSHATLAVAVNEKAALESSIAKLVEEEITLKAKQETLFGLANVESYATENLNMEKISTEQIVYIDLSNPDVIEVSQGSVTLKFETALEQAKEILNGVASYLS